MQSKSDEKLLFRVITYADTNGRMEMRIYMNIKTDVVIAGTGVGGLFCALNLPPDNGLM